MKNLLVARVAVVGDEDVENGRTLGRVTGARI
jgi:hypothetical protein